jgi:hypothetical protein
VNEVVPASITSAIFDDTLLLIDLTPLKTGETYLIPLPRSEEGANLERDFARPYLFLLLGWSGFFSAALGLLDVLSALAAHDRLPP